MSEEFLPNRVTLIVSILLLQQGCGGALIPEAGQRIGSGVDKQLKGHRLVDSGGPVSQWAREFIRPLVKGPKSSVTQRFRRL